MTPAHMTFLQYVALTYTALWLLHNMPFHMELPADISQCVYNRPHVMAFSRMAVSYGDASNSILGVIELW